MINSIFFKFWPQLDISLEIKTLFWSILLSHASKSTKKGINLPQASNNKKNWFWPKKTLNFKVHWKRTFPSLRTRHGRNMPSWNLWLVRKQHINFSMKLPTLEKCLIINQQMLKWNWIAYTKLWIFWNLMTLSCEKSKLKNLENKIKAGD